MPGNGAKRRETRALCHLSSHLFPLPTRLLPAFSQVNVCPIMPLRKGLRFSHGSWLISPPFPWFSSALCSLCSFAAIFAFLYPCFIRVPSVARPSAFWIL